MLRALLFLDLCGHEYIVTYVRTDGHVYKMYCMDVECRVHVYVHMYVLSLACAKL